MIMATETVKMILGIGEPLVGRLLLYDSLHMSFKNVKVRPNPECDLCGDDPSIFELIDYETFCNVPMPGEELPSPEEFAMSPQELKSLLDSGRPIKLIDVREPHEFDINRIESAELTPLSRFETYIPDMDPNEEIYIYCYKGTRSMTALKKLKDKGFTKLKSLDGGIDNWAVEIDHDMPRY